MDDVVVVTPGKSVWSLNLVDAQEEALLNEDVLVTLMVVPIKVSCDIDKSLKNFKFDIRHLKKIILTDFEIAHFVNHNLTTLVDQRLAHLFLACLLALGFDSAG